MLGLETLDVILGLAFLYLLLSLLCSAAKELVAQWLDLRADALHEGIHWLLARDGERPTSLIEARQRVAEAEQELNSAKQGLKANGVPAFTAYEEAKKKGFSLFHVGDNV